MQRLARIIRAAAAAASLGALAACGSGGQPPPASAGPAPAASAPTPAQASRFLVQATFGPAPRDIERVTTFGFANWIEQQFATPPLDTHWDYTVVRRGPLGCNPCDSEFINAAMESFWKQAIDGPDQLRQRVVFALSEIFVVSTVNSAVDGQKEAHASYLDMLGRHAFGNFRELLSEVSTHPTMALYLSSLRNEKEDPATGRLPDENYARELMQLFTIGLWQLEADGSRRLDGAGRPIPTYGQDDVMGLAKVFTGWSWNGPDTSLDRWNGWLGAAGYTWREQLQNYAAHHSGSDKNFLGRSVAAGSDGPQSLQAAIDTLFAHPNVGPFIGAQLIQRLVTSNPSPAYVGRVAAAFADNGQGVRGDMRALIRAVLLDPEARDDARIADPAWGKLREPMLRYSHFLRAFSASAPSGVLRIWNLEDPVASLGQNPLRAPSVFNWFRPDYAPPGEIEARGLVAPEFQITDETTTTGYANFVLNVAERQTAWFRASIASTDVHYLGANYDAQVALASDPAALVEHLNLLLVAGQMSAPTRSLIVDAVSAVPESRNAGHSRVSTAVALTLLTPEFIVQK
jgi:uncharacterized protein (DUF1800 family)